MHTPGHATERVPHLRQVVLTRESGEGKLEEVDILHEGKRPCKRQLVKTSNKPLAQIARDLGIADSTLHHWRQLEASHGEQGFPGSGHQTAKARGNQAFEARG